MRGIRDKRDARYEMRDARCERYERHGMREMREMRGARGTRRWSARDASRNVDPDAGRALCDPRGAPARHETVPRRRSTSPGHRMAILRDHIFVKLYMKIRIQTSPVTNVAQLKILGEKIFNRNSSKNLQSVPSGDSKVFTQILFSGRPPTCCPTSKSF